MPKRAKCPDKNRTGFTNLDSNLHNKICFEISNPPGLILVDYFLNTGPRVSAASLYYVIISNDHIFMTNTSILPSEKIGT